MSDGPKTFFDIFEEETGIKTEEFAAACRKANPNSPLGLLLPGMKWDAERRAEWQWRKEKGTL